MTTPIPAQGAGRIRWHDHTSSSIIYAIAWTGYVGTIEEPAFKIYRPDELHARWLLSVRFATAGCEFFYADSDDELKERAERWLEEFVSSLGASFPAGPVVSRCECGGLASHRHGCRWRQGYGSLIESVLEECQP